MINWDPMAEVIKMKKNLCILYVSFILLECFSQQIVKTSKSTNIYDHSFSIIETIEKNKKIQISQYLFEYLNNGKNEYDYYAELINEYEGLKIRANDLIPEITDDIFDADILTKSGNVYFIDDYFQGLKKRNINIIYDCYSTTVEKEKNDDDYRDWKECCTFYQNNTYITNIQFSFNNYFTIFDGEITNIQKNNDTYKLIVGHYYYSDHNQKTGIRNNELPNEGENFIFYLKVDGDYFSFYLPDNKTLIQTFIRTDEQTKREFEKFLKTGKYDESKITWPRHADGTCDYETSVRLQSGKRYCASDNLRLRASGSTAGKPVVTIGNGTQVKVLSIGAKQTIDGITSNWVQVEVQAGAKDRDGKAYCRRDGRVVLRSGYLE